MSYQGHLPDGSSVQKHSAGALYPYVIMVRDAVINLKGKYDYGLIGPELPNGGWYGSFEMAVDCAKYLKAKYEARVKDSCK